jgi:hypothetical protein
VIKDQFDNDAHIILEIDENDHQNYPVFCDLARTESALYAFAEHGKAVGKTHMIRIGVGRPGDESSLLQKAKLVAQLIRNEAIAIGSCSGLSIEETFQKPSV